MAYTPFTAATYPDVPVGLGIPPVFRKKVPIELPKMTADGRLAGAPAGPIWGIYNSAGVKLVTPDNVASVEYQREFRVSTYPVAGKDTLGFASYDKVATPAETRVTMTKGGGIDARTEFLAVIDAAVASLDLYTVVTPDAFYLNANLTRYDYHRASDRGAALLTVELMLTEIRIASDPVFTNSKSVAAATDKSIGAVQATAPTAHQTPKGPPD